MSKDALRAKLFSSRNQHKKLIEIEADGEKVQIEIRQPSIAVRTKVGMLSKVDMKGQAADLEAMEQGRLLAVMECCFDPETGDKLFDARDKDSLFKQAKWYDRVANECLGILRYTKEDAEDAEKNSETTQPAS